METRTINSPIFLCGMPGSGKTSIGRKLAELAGLPFYDTDRIVETEEGCTVAELFFKKGEAYFRKKEETVIAELASGVPAVISLGGGALEFGETLKTVLEKGILVWIDTPIPVLVTRLWVDATRPLLRNADGSLRTQAELKEFLTKLLAHRQTRYLSSRIHFIPEGSAEHDSRMLLRYLLTAP